MASVTAALLSTSFMTPRSSRSNMNSSASRGQLQQQPHSQPQVQQYHPPQQQPLQHHHQQQQQQSIHVQEEDDGEESQADEQFASFFCRALYDYEAQDASALSFRQNNIIEVLSQQPSGWWDGLLGDNRGWFPSNYVTVISEEEAEMALENTDLGAAQAHIQQQRSQVDDSVLDMSHVIRGNQSESEDWSDNELALRSGVRAFANGSLLKDKSSDFWVPQVAQDGRIFYVNTQTGQRSRDIPQEVEDEASDGDFAGLTSQSSSRSGTSAGLGFASSDSEASSSVPNAAGFDSLRRSGTPEPWVRKLADDGMAYYYYNKVDGTVQWTRPEPTQQPIKSKLHQLRLGEGLTRSNSIRRSSVYSDDSDVHPLDNASSVNRLTDQRRRRKPSIEEEPIIMQLTSAEKIAQSLQKALSPPPPELVTDLSNIARNAIQSVVESIQANGLVPRPEQDKRMDELIHGAVDAVRNLLYIVTSPSGHIPSTVLPPDAAGYAPNPTHASLKLVQRRVTATLSRLVLSARAIQYDSGSSVVDTLHKIEVDAEELERAVLSFVLEVQRVEHASEDGRAPKRLKGVFDTANIGLGLVGAGAGGEWKGFGWVASDDSNSALQTLLRGEALAEIDSRIAQIEASFRGLLHYFKVSEEGSVHQTRLRSQQVLGHLNGFLKFVADIHVARHVDVDGIRQEAGSTASEPYLQTVAKARQLIRTLETSVQAIFDESSALLCSTQRLFECEPGITNLDRRSLHEHFAALSVSLQTNLGIVRQTLKALFSIGNDQAEMDQGDYNGSIEWRITRLSFIDNRFGGSIRAVSPTLDTESTVDDVVDMEQAFSNAPRPRQTSEATYSMTSVATDNTYVDHQHQHRPSMDSDATAMAPPTSAGGGDEELYLDSDEELPRPPIRKSKSGKLERILGESVPTKPATPPPPSQSEPQPWYLQPFYDPATIAIDPDNSVKGGTVPALVERLTAHEQSDPTYVKSFLMTYKSFTTLNELFDLLVARFKIQPPDGLTATELEHWKKMKQHVIQMRVLNTLKSMVVDEDFLEKEDIYILDRMKNFITSEEVAKFAAAKQLMILIDRLQQGQDAIPRTMVAQGPPPPPIVPKAGKKLKLLDIEPLELARQLTIMESHLYQKIKPMECLQRAREQRTENMDNIAVVIQTSNRIADWVAESILSKEDSRRRAAVVKHLIMAADRCRSVNNFSTMIAITSGLNTPPIRRLKRTWEQVNSRTMAQFAACEMTIDSNKNFTKYRQLMQSVTPPCVPFIGVFLSTLQFIQDGNPDSLPGNLVNFRKRQKASEVIQDIKRWQAQPFNYQPVESILTFIEESLSQFNDTRASSDYFWELSLEREPREREDERMARLLQESGFL